MLFANGWRNSWYFRNALLRANHNDLVNGIHATTKVLELFFSNLWVGTNHELKNRYMHVDYVDESQSVNFKISKCQNDTLECSLEELAIIRLLKKNPDMNQKSLAERTGKSLSTVKRMMDSLQQKNYIRRTNGKRYGTGEVLVEVSE